jgi:hypothetical protein
MEATVRVLARRLSRPVESPDPDDRGHGPQPREATRRTVTQGGYRLWVRRHGEPRDDDKDHDGNRIAQDG